MPLFLGKEPYLHVQIYLYDCSLSKTIEFCWKLAILFKQCLLSSSLLCAFLFIFAILNHILPIRFMLMIKLCLVYAFYVSVHPVGKTSQNYSKIRRIAVAFFAKFSILGRKSVALRKFVLSVVRSFRI